MRWEVSGWRGVEEGRWSVDAESEGAARDRAAAAGIMVQQVDCVEDPSSALARVSAVGVVPPAATAQCENCGRAIGRLEMPWNWDGHLVCQDCAARLSPADVPQQQSQSPTQVNVSVTAPAYYTTTGAGRRTVTVERTGKVWKAQIAMSTLCTIVGVVTLCGAAGASGSGVSAIGGVALGVIGLAGLGLTAFGLAWFILARMGAWWNHG